MEMQRDVLIVIGVVALALVLALVWVTMQRRRREHLKRRFGPEYDQTVQHRKDLREAERELEARERRVAKFDIRPLSREDAARFTEAWRQTQARFVDDPQGAVTDADRLVTELMDARGYPISDFAQRAADISVDHPRVVVNYRAARAIAERHAHGEASTEDLRQALVHYRELFSDLLETQGEEPERQPIRRAAGAGGGR
jgi:FtsZ-interacting cell division protein ZipA